MYKYTKPLLFLHKYTFIYLCVRPPNTCEVIYLEVLDAGGRGAETTVLLEDTLLYCWRTRHV